MNEHENKSSADIELLRETLATLADVSNRIIAAGAAGDVSSEEIAESLYVAARLFSSKTDRQGKQEWPIEADVLNATETVVLVTALLEAADVNLFDMAIWYRRAQ